MKAKGWQKDTRKDRTISDQLQETMDFFYLSKALKELLGKLIPETPFKIIKPFPAFSYLFYNFLDFHWMCSVTN